MYLEIIKKLLHKKNLRLGQLNQVEKNVILLSSIYNIMPGHKYKESGFNQTLDAFCLLISPTFVLDRSELRRTLIDDKFMVRTTDCKTYWLSELSVSTENIKTSLMNYDLNKEISCIYEAINQEKELKKASWLKNNSLAC